MNTMFGKALFITVAGLLIGGCNVTTTGPGDAPKPPPSDKWTEGAPVPIAILEFGSAVYRGEIYIAGGLEINSLLPVPDAYKYNPTTDTWSPIAPLPDNRKLLSLVAVGDSLYALGGQSSAVSTEIENNNWVYNPDLNQWESRAPLPGARAGGAAVGVAGEVYLVGGFNEFAIPQTPVFIYNPTSNSWRLGAGIITPRNRLAAGVIGTRIYVAGGRSNDPGTEFDRLEIYDITADSWSSGPAMPIDRAGVAGAVLGGKFHVLGGAANEVVYNLNLTFNPGLQIWESEDGMPTPRFALGAVELGGLIYTIGGVSIIGDDQQLEIFNPNP